MRKIISNPNIVIFSALLFAGFACWLGQDSLTGFGVAQGPSLCGGDCESAKVILGGLHAIECEIADTPEERATGLMDRETLEQDYGMLFVYKSKGAHPFWMKNTRVPLDIIWVDADMKIAHIEQASPCETETCETYEADRPTLYTIETNAGFCEKNGIAEGDSVNIILQ